MISRAKGDGWGRSEYTERAGEKSGKKGGSAAMEEMVANVWKNMTPSSSKTRH